MSGTAAAGAAGLSSTRMRRAKKASRACIAAATVLPASSLELVGGRHTTPGDSLPSSRGISGTTGAAAGLCITRSRRAKNAAWALLAVSSVFTPSNASTVI